MLRIEAVCLEMLAELSGVVDEIAVRDRDHARQLRRSMMSVYLNMTEGSGSRGGTRRTRYDNSLGSAEETRANLRAAVAVGYLKAVDEEPLDKLDRIIRTLVRILY